MSGISGIQGQNWGMQLQRLQLRGAGDNGPVTTPFEHAAESAGLDLSTVEGLRERVQQAVEEAVRGAQSEDPKAAMQAIQEAVDRVLEENGIDPEEIRSRMASAQTGAGPRGTEAPGGPPPGGMRGGPPPGGMTGSPPPGAPAGGPTGSPAADSTDAETEADTELEKLLEGILAAISGTDDASTTTFGQLLEALQSSDAETKDSVQTKLEQILEELQSSDTNAQDAGKAELGQLADQLAGTVPLQGPGLADQAPRLAYAVTTMLFGPAVDGYA